MEKLPAFSDLGDNFKQVADEAVRSALRRQDN